MGEPRNVRDQVTAEEWETFRRCRFVRKTFHPYQCLVTLTPLNEEGGRLWKPYRGQTYDPAVYELVEDGWDHEHCDVCFTKVRDGDIYWANDGPEHVDLCETCYPLVYRQLRPTS